jgi:hypothetical protein
MFNNRDNGATIDDKIWWIPDWLYEARVEATHISTVFCTTNTLRNLSK